MNDDELTKFNELLIDFTNSKTFLFVVWKAL